MTPEQVVRSRYSAYARGEVAYLLATWHPRTRPRELAPDPERRWTGLQVRAATGDGLYDREGTVRYAARSRVGGRQEVLEATSRFVREGGRWLYVDDLPD